MLSDSAFFKTSVSGILSSCFILSIFLRHLRWKELTFFACLLYTVQFSHPYKNKGNTTALYTFIFVFVYIPLLSQALSRNLPNAELAFERRVVTSSSRLALLDSVLPRHVNLSTAGST